MNVLKLPSGGAVLSIKVIVAITRQDLEAVARRAFAARRPVRTRTKLLRKALNLLSNKGTDALAELHLAHTSHAREAALVVRRLFPELVSQRLTPSRN